MFRYWTVGPGARAWGIYVVNAGHAIVPPRSPYPPSGHPQDHHGVARGRVLPTFHFLYIAAGQGELETEVTGQRRLVAGDLVILQRGLWHRYRPVSDVGWHEYWLEFDGDIAGRWMGRKEFQEAGLVVPIGSCPSAFERVIDLLHQERPGMDLLLGALAGETIAQVLGVMKRGSGKTRPPSMVVHEAMTQLAKGHADPCRMTEFAERRNLSYPVFRRLFKAETGCSPQQFVLETKMNWAKTMLVSSDAAIGRIAREVGFDSIFYFTRVFKRWHGQKPSAIRDSARVSQPPPWVVPSESTRCSLNACRDPNLGSMRQLARVHGSTRLPKVEGPLRPDHRSSFRHPPVSADARAWGIYVLSAGHAIVPPWAPYPPCQHPQDHRGEVRGTGLPTYKFLYVAAGQGEIESRGSSIRRLVAGDLVILHPDQYHRYRPAIDVGWHEYWFEFDGDLAMRLMNRKEFLDAVPVFHVGPCQPFLDRMIDLVDTDQPGMDLMLGAFAMETIAELLAVLAESRFQVRPACKAIRDARNLLTQGPMCPKRLMDFAVQLNVSYSAFRRTFKAETGLSPRQFVVNTRMQRAKELLAATDLSIGRVAERVGYDSVHYFSRLFRQRQGQTPSSFRETARRLQSLPRMELRTASTPNESAAVCSD